MKPRPLGLLIFAFSGTIFAAEGLPFVSSEILEFVSFKGLKKNDIFHADEYVGKISRLGEKKDERREMDFYHFTKSERIQLTDKDCRDLAHSVFSLKEKKEKDYPFIADSAVFSSRLGNACEVLIQDHAPGINYKERMLYALIIKNQLYAVTTRSKSSFTKDDKENLRAFIKSLK